MVANTVNSYVYSFSPSSHTPLATSPTFVGFRDLASMRRG